MDRLKIISLFSGCGGMDLGFHGDFEVLTKSISGHLSEIATLSDNQNYSILPRLNYDIVFANDILQPAYQAWKHYFCTKYHLDSNVYHLESIVNLVKKAENTDDHFAFPYADVVIGGFPCQDFSIAGKRKGFKSKRSHNGSIISENMIEENATEENRGKLYIWMKKVIELVQPKVFIAENVKGLISLNDVVDIITADFSSIGGNGYFILPVQTLYAPDYGIPQNRERVIFIGVKKSALKPGILTSLINGSICLYPQKTHGKNFNPYVTCCDVLQDLPEPEFSNDKSHMSYSKAKWYGKHCQGQTEINWNGVAPTIRAEHHGNIEFRRLNVENGGKNQENLNLNNFNQRRLSVRECARLQTFPNDYQFVIPRILNASNGYKVIGNAVPPLLAYHLGYTIQNKWNELFFEE